MLIKRLPAQPLDPLLPLIPLGHHRFAIVDPEDYHWIRKYYWFVLTSHSISYAARCVRKNGKAYYYRMHREIMKTPKDMQVHHINSNPFDNRKCNMVNVYPKDHPQTRSH